VHTATGLTVRVRRAVIADVNAPTLYRTLLPAAAVPGRLRDDLDRFVWDTPVVKVNWALDRPIPWRAPEVAGAGTVHLGADDLGLVRWSAAIESRTLPVSPYMLFGQMTTADPSRSPAGTESAWAYTHLPRGIDDDASADEIARRMDATVEAFAPGFSGSVVHRHVQRPRDLESAEPNLVSGAVNGGTAQLFQQLVFRPVPGLGRPETVVGNLYLGGSSAHPGGGVHGICGGLAARAALRGQGLRGRVRRRALSAALDLLYRG
jgi:phytoene dehydrogenase-like protein